MAGAVTQSIESLCLCPKQSVVIVTKLLGKRQSPAPVFLGTGLVSITKTCFGYVVVVIRGGGVRAYTGPKRPSFALGEG